MSGMPDDAARLVTRLNDAFPKLGTAVLDAGEARRLFAEVRRPVEHPTPVANARDSTISGASGQPLRLRWYHPLTPCRAEGVAVVVFLHGGGWVLGDLDSHDEIARRLADGSGAEVVAVDYRRAPEHPYPAALEDAVSAVRHVAMVARQHGIRTARLVVVGDSAGGNLAAAVCLQLRGEHPHIAGQVLLYPMLDRSCSSASYEENAVGYYITRHHLQWFWEQYLSRSLPDATGFASPMGVGDLSGLPPAFIVTAQFDPLRDEGERYAARMRSSRSRAEARRYEGAFHGFLGFPDDVEVAKAAFDEVCEAVRNMACS